MTTTCEPGPLGAAAAEAGAEGAAAGAAGDAEEPADGAGEAAGGASVGSVPWSESAASSVRITEPSATLSPTFTFSSLTVPANGAGTSMVALSDSSVISGSSGATVSPGATSSSMIGTSAKSPMSGTLTSTITAVPCAGR